MRELGTVVCDSVFLHADKDEALIGTPVAVLYRGDKLDVIEKKPGRVISMHLRVKVITTGNIGWVAQSKRNEVYVTLETLPEPKPAPVPAPHNAAPVNQPWPLLAAAIVVAGLLVALLYAL